MFTRLLASAIADPLGSLLLLLIVLCVSALAALIVSAMQEARRSRAVSVEELRRDAFTTERRSKLKRLQGRVRKGRQS